MSTLQPNVGRTLYKAILQAANSLEVQLLKCQSLRFRELENLESSISSQVPKDLRGLLEIPKIVKLAEEKSNLFVSNNNKNKNIKTSLKYQPSNDLIKNYIRLCSRRVVEASEAPGLQDLDLRIGFACMKHLNNRIDTLNHLVYDRISNAEKFGIQVGIQSEFQGSDKHRYFFRYHVRILNTSDNTVKLISRNWTIRDLDGRIISIEGPGVLGCFPTLLPNQSYEYTSNVPLQTPLGTQSGHYMFVTLQQEQQLQNYNNSTSNNSTVKSKMLQVPIAPFSHRTPSVDDNQSVDSSSSSSSPNSNSNSLSVKPGRRKKRNNDDSRRRL